MKFRSGTTAVLIAALWAGEIILLSGCKEDPVIPTLSTSSVSDITISTATTGGNITSDGGAEVTSRGVCWGTSSLPAISGTHTTDSKGPGVFLSNLTGLIPNTLYYVRAYAVNNAGTAYGKEVSFTTNPLVAPVLTTVDVTGITSSSAVSGGNISSDGGAAITARGICWATTANPTITNSKTTNGSGTGIFAANMTGLVPGTEYHVRAYATNNVGTSYGNDLKFPTTAVSPTLTTALISLVTRNSAASGGNISSNGGAAVTARGVCWSTAANPLVSGAHTSDGTGSGSFTSNITGLAPNTIYHVRAYATNSAGTSYGNELTFPTDPVLVPVVSTAAVTTVTLSTALSGGNVTQENGAVVTEKGVCWNTTGNPTIANSKTSDGTGTGTFTSDMTGLTTSTTYYLRAFATNSAGTAYGSQIKFSTSVADIEGNIYKTVIIGNQLWMQSDLKTTKFTDNSQIPNVESAAGWMAATTSAYCWYNNNPSETFGVLYNWFTVETEKLCPSGWHVPTDAEFKTLEVFLGMTQEQTDATLWRGSDQGTQLKSTSTWDGNGTNTSGFSALGSGYRYGADGSFYNQGTVAYWWSSTLHWSDTTKALYRRLDGNQTGVYREGVIKAGGKNVRCLKN